MPRRVAVAIAVALALVVSGGTYLLVGGDDTVPLSTVAKAAEATSGAGGFKLTIDGRLEVAQLGRELPLKGSGELDPKTKRGRLKFDAAAALGGGAGQIEQIFAGDVIYMRTPAFAQQLGAKKPWIKLNLRQAGQALGVDAGQLSQLGGNDPRQMLDQIRSVSGEVEKLGSERVRGEDTTHYKAEVDLRKYPDRLPEAQREQARVAVERLVDMTGSSTYPMELWIDDDDLVRRVKVAYELNPPGQQQTSSFSMTMEFFDFGTPIDVTPPPAKDVQDLAELAERLGRLQQGQTQ
ncbi:MAG: hypothetical protein M3340_09655 [Actinomycetota bacterium]|nr:hypothetical protein [Actinomycetota bacterium]